MKARVKATGEIVKVRGIYTPTIRTFGLEEIESYDMEAVEIITDPDYWEKLKHQYAGMAMQGLVTRGEVLGSSVQEIARDIAEISCEVAHALVEKMKEKEERK